MMDPALLLLAAGCATAWLGIAENVPLGRADEPRDPFDPKLHPWWPRATCHSCFRQHVPIIRDTGRLLLHRPSLGSGAACDDDDTYFAEYDAWEQAEEPNL